MTLLDELNARLLDSKERLRRLESSIEDISAAAGQSGTEFGPAEYLALAEDLRKEADKTRSLIDRLEKLRAVEQIKSL